MDNQLTVKLLAFLWLPSWVGGGIACGALVSLDTLWNDSVAENLVDDDDDDDDSISHAMKKTMTNKTDKGRTPNRFVRDNIFILNDDAANAGSRSVSDAQEIVSNVPSFCGGRCCCCGCGCLFALLPPTDISIKFSCEIFRRTPKLLYTLEYSEIWFLSKNCQNEDFFGGTGRWVGKGGRQPCRYRIAKNETMTERRPNREHPYNMLPFRHIPHIIVFPKSQCASTL